MTSAIYQRVKSSDGRFLPQRKAGDEGQQMCLVTLCFSIQTPPSHLGNVLGKGKNPPLPHCSQCKPLSVLTSRRAALSISLVPSCSVLAPLSAGGGLHTEVAWKKQLDFAGSRGVQLKGQMSNACLPQHIYGEYDEEDRTRMLICTGRSGALRHHKGPTGEL